MAALISENRPTTLSSPMDGCPLHIQQYPLVCNDLFVDLTDPKSVGPLIYTIFPAWASAPIVLSGFDLDDSTTTTLSPQSPQIYKANDVSSSKVVVKRLTGGITNVLFQATYFYPATPSMTLDFSSTTKSTSSPTSIGDLDSTVPSSAVTTAPSSSAASTTSTFVSDDDCLSDSTQVKASSYTNNHSIPSNENSITVLIRAYGNGTDTIIDRDREFATHQHLHSKNLAPQIYARFGNGLVYAYLPGRAIDYTLLSHPDVTVAVARRLAEWHNKLNAQEIESQIETLKKKQCGSTPNTFEQSFSKTLWDLLKSWIAAMPTDIITSHTKDELLDELKWIKAEIGQKGGPMVVAHCDLLAGNVIVPPQWTPRSIDTTTEPSPSAKPSLEVSFIDYEYAMNSPRAFDIANHFMEWQGFDCIKELIPEPTMDNAIIRNWARDYLSYFTQGSVNEDTVTELVSQILNWWGMPGFYWGIWSAIQSTISNIEFDYANYANERLVEYWEWKKNYLNQTKN